MSVYRNPEREFEAQRAALRLRAEFGIQEVGTGLVLGTGWGDVLKLEDAKEIPFQALGGFNSLGSLEGHSRTVVCGKLEGVPVVALRGRVHLNEGPSCKQLSDMVRLQVEMLLQFGVKNLILTAAVGGLPRKKDVTDWSWVPKVGEICVFDGFITLHAPDMPLYVGEFRMPEDILDEGLRKIGLEEAKPLFAHAGGHAMVRGPFFEGRKYDKQILADEGAKVVGMSCLPEACIAMLYPDVRVLGLGFITNGSDEVHSHPENQKRAKAQAEHLGGYLARIVKRIG